MTIATARDKFNTLREQIIKDGKIDFDETQMLLDFIEPYVKANNKKFTEFSRIIHIARIDGKISDEESKILIASINDMSEFLKIEARIENFLAGFGIIVIFGIILGKVFNLY